MGGRGVGGRGRSHFEGGPGATGAPPGMRGGLGTGAPPRVCIWGPPPHSYPHSGVYGQSEGLTERINEPPWGRCLQGAVDVRWVVVVVVVASSSPHRGGVRGDPGRSRAIRGDPGRSGAIRGDPGRSGAIQGDPGRSGRSGGDQGRSKAIQGDPGRSRATLGYPGVPWGTLGHFGLIVLRHTASLFCHQ